MNPSMHENRHLVGPNLKTNMNMNMNMNMNVQMKRADHAQNSVAPTVLCIF